MVTRIKSRGITGREKPHFDIQVRLFTEEIFPLRQISTDMKIYELKHYMEFAAGIPINMQKISYLDTGELLNHSSIKGNDIVAGATLFLGVWPMWKELIEAASLGDIDWVFSLGVTIPTAYRTPQSDYMTKRAKKAWLEERGFLALFIAAHRGHEKLVKRLIETGLDLNACTPCGRTALHAAASQGRGNIVDILLESGADIDAEDDEGETALSIAAKFNHKSCERHLFLFRWQERAKRTRPSAQPKRMAHQFFDSAFPVWMSGPQSQLYFTNILPPDDFEGTRLDSPKKKVRKPEFSRNGTEESFEQPDDEEYDEDGNRLPVIREERQKKPKSGSTLSFDDWLKRKKAIEQRAIDIRKAAEEKIRLEEEERKRLEAEKSQSYETWLAQREAEKKKVEFQRMRENEPTLEKGPGALRSYLRNLGRTRTGDLYEDWLNQKEEEINLQDFKTKMTVATAGN
ncbi:hypothetical protein FSP39_018250 [Pinctada imbricata]|uniref:Ankyrin repeat domain-containing protein 60 n=1 Tax=Pinctada imbricata TaxID=66713 RepID=A0AA88XS00_PINIB|nr:hypothetical protein FSP39_018250 [Pinctada imbricata]